MDDIDAARQIGKTIPAAARPDFPPVPAPSKPVRTLARRATCASLVAVCTRANVEQAASLGLQRAYTDRLDMTSAHVQGAIAGGDRGS